MKKIIINIILVFCSVLSYAQHQDTIEYGEGGYWFPVDDYSHGYVNYPSYPFRFSGNIYAPVQNRRILGLSCIMDSCVGHGVTLVLAKYIGPDSVLSRTFVQNISSHADTVLGKYNNPLDVYYQNIDSVRIYPGTMPTRGISLQLYGSSTVYNVFDAFFDSVITMNDSSIYIVYLKFYPIFQPNGIVMSSLPRIGHFNSEDKSNCVISHLETDVGIEHNGYYIGTNHELINDLDTIFSLWENPRRLELYALHGFRAVFPIIEDEYDLEVHYACPPPGRPTVTVDRRRAAFEWEGDSAYCAYELAYGGAGEDRSAYTTIVTTADTCSVMTLLPGERYACRLRGLCCSSDGDSVWSVWSDTVQFERVVYTVTGRSNNISIGYVQGTRTVDVGDTVELRAIPRYEDVRFLQWTGGDTVNPLRIVAVCDTTVMAYFQRYVDTTQPPDTTVVEGIAEAIERGIVLRPNPAWEEVTVESSEPIVGIEVCDLWGREVQSQTVPSATEVVVGVGGMRSGVYIVKVRTSQGCAIRKLVVKHRDE